MADPTIDIHESSVLIVPPSDKPIRLAFFVHGEPIPIMRNELGKIAPRVEAQYYIGLVNGNVASIETKAQVMDELELALDAGASVKWSRS